jgi:hypothetical protein
MPAQRLLSEAILDMACRFYECFKPINVSELSHYTPAQSINN